VGFDFRFSKRRDSQSEARPPFGSWRRAYLAVIINLIVLLVLLFVFMRAFQ